MSTVPRFRFPIGYDPCNPNIPPEQQQKLLFIRPWARYGTNCIDNKTVTQQQLQMRVKAEILQYKTKHVRLTKAEVYALAARKHYVKRHYTPKAHIDENGNIVAAKNTNIIYATNNSALALEFNNENCGNGKITTHKSSASDVPGKSIDLFLDPKVPLVRFNNPQRVFRAGGFYNVDNTIYNAINDENPLTTRITSNTTTIQVTINGELSAATLAQIATNQGDAGFKNPSEIVIGTGVTSINGDVLGGISLTIDGNPKRIETFDYKTSNQHQCSSIGDYAFFICPKLTSVNIPDSVTSIGSHAFYNCLTLPSLTIPNSVTSIGIYMAYYCPALTSVIIGDSLSTISEGAFDSCLNLSTIKFNGSGANRNVLLEFKAFATSKTYNPTLPIPLVATTITIPASGKTYVAV